MAVTGEHCHTSAVHIVRSTAKIGSISSSSTIFEVGFAVADTTLILRIKPASKVLCHQGKKISRKLNTIMVLHHHPFHFFVQLEVGLDSFFEIFDFNWEVNSA